MTKKSVAKTLYRVFGPPAIVMIVFALAYTAMPHRVDVVKPQPQRVEQLTKAELDAQYYEMIRGQDDKARMRQVFKDPTCTHPDVWKEKREGLPSTMLVRLGEGVYKVRPWTYPVPKRVQAVIALCA